MWNDNANAGGFNAGYTGGAGDGGFMNSSSFDTPGKEPAKKVRGSQRIGSVSIKTLVENTADTLTIEGFEINMIKVVGLVRKVEETHTKVNYVLDDHTGLLDVCRFVEDNDDESEQSVPCVEGQYVRAIGSLRMMHGKPSLLCFKIQPIEDLNMLTTHLLQVVHQRLKYKQYKEKSSTTNGDGGYTPVLENSSMQEQTPLPGAGGSFSGAPHDMVYQAIGSFQNVAGVSKPMMASVLGGKLSQHDITKAITHLLEQGMIYSSTDEDHYLVIG